jgi:1,4-alpha-glucan branching enzyme
MCALAALSVAGVAYGNWLPFANAAEPVMDPSITEEELRKLIECRHDAPHRVLGPHLVENGERRVIRAFLPHAARVVVSGSDPWGPELAMERIHPDGLFEVSIPGAKRDLDYQFIVTGQDGHTLRFHDPYAFVESTLSTSDLEPFAQGAHPRLFDLFGARPMARGRTQGIHFAVWAPNAKPTKSCRPCTG